MRKALSDPRSLDEILSGTIRAKPRTYHGITFRSRLEARFAQHLDLTGERWAYEPRVYGHYLPDFEILSGSRPIFIEVKPTRAEVPDAKEKMSVIWRSHPDALLMVAVEEGRTFYACLAGQKWRTWQERWAV